MSFHCTVIADISVADDTKTTDSVGVNDLKRPL